MGELEYDKSSKEWARDKGLIRKCYYCGKYYDPHIGCTNPVCIEKQKEEERKLREAEKERKEKKRRLKDTFDRIIWPDQ
jgi:hypothetical protein